MKRPSNLLFAAVLTMLCACSKPTPAVSQQQPAASSTPTSEVAEPADPRFIGRVWVSTTAGSARGSILIFLPDRTLLMDSCFETFRLSRWGVAGDHIRWIEDTIPIEAEVVLPDENELLLRIVGQEKVQTYVAASLPYKCPDMPR